MLEQKGIVENFDEVIKKLNRRHDDFSYLQDIKKLSVQRRELIGKSEKLKEKRNLESKKVGTLIAEKKDQEVQKNKKLINTIKQEIEIIDGQLDEVEEKIKAILEATPNIPDDSVPSGEDKNDNVEIRKWGKISNHQKVKEHWEVATKLDLIDFDRGTKISGSRFVVYKGMGAKLERALMNFMLDEHAKRGYIEIEPPILVQPQIMYGTGNLPKFKEDLYYIEKDNLYLIPTSEVPVTNLYREEILEKDQLPIYHTAYTPCFRQESGSAGRDTKGIIRLHQFKKVEMVKFTTEEASFEELEKMVLDAENILQLLEIPYRVILLCSGDMGFSSTKTYDVEVWMPGQNKYREISSCSNCLDFQARRMKLRYRDDNEIKYVHTLNGSGLAIDRLIAAILENYQNEDGTITIPKKLQPYFQNQTVIV
ncbi:serine--tRNA ligase [Spiroplasma citri]|uniref:Serine--tRNA ligase n=1 Tax=Spiroplasma citri TaxID=2133 RepID=A0AAJ4EHP9_SPICI|nr:serine--tRNA ligase [Spiroplasma citri]APE73926.1 seryl-tRNA synthetase [Spiroplasma citri]QED23959.1 serine--tRNA ligase [Spiroplasma citri]QIA66225.1 serine--tRNA ligase [Spiroplasma citri]QIA68078.1 serine--tRNA ligase [Spiroplasma citri]QIA69954.1 serine--tRNA ligase [Spiroplasma citri]